MERYADRNGDSGVTGYEIGQGYIDVQFKTGAVYRYTADRPGPVHVNQMIALAQAGEGLNSYINRRVRKNFSVQLR